MQTDDIWNHAIDWLWAVLAGAFIVIARSIIRLRGHEERIKALELSDERMEKTLRDLAKKMDDTHSATRSHIDSRVDDIRADLRIIMGRCLTVNHEGEK